MTTKHSPEKKDIATPTPKNLRWSPIYNTPQKILANLEVLMKVARERLYVPPGFSFPAFQLSQGKGATGTMCRLCVNNVRENCGETRREREWRLFKSPRLTGDVQFRTAH